MLRVGHYHNIFKKYYCFGASFQTVFFGAMRGRVICLNIIIISPALPHQTNSLPADLLPVKAQS